MNYKPIIMFVGLIILVGGIMAFALDPTIIDAYTKSGSYVKFGVYVDRAILSDPNIVNFNVEEKTGCSNIMAVSSATLNTKVVIKIADYKQFETTGIDTPWSGGGGWIYGCSFIPIGQYQITYTSFNKGGELCNPLGGCSWQQDDIVTKTLTVSDSGVTLA